ncbi:MAG: MSEP-CTERM sorting domain-containing protein [Spirochaetales bacterium]|nr:MSEP-CTERM sorting domain-containing protein [Spirochaetales bacterium]
MNIANSLFFSKTRTRILIILIPRLLVILFLLVQETFWHEGTFLKDLMPLSILIAADLLVSIFYTFQPFKKIFKTCGRTLTDTLFFFYSVIVCYFMVFSISMPRLFGPSENPYENILIVAIIQLISLGFLFSNLSLRLIPKNFSKRPYLPLGLGVLSFVLSFLLQSVIQSVFNTVINNISVHVAALCMIFYCITVFYLLYSGCWLCYRKYLRTYKPAQVLLKIFTALGLVLIILLTVIFQKDYSPFNVMGFLAPGMFRLLIEYSLLWICFFIGMTGLTMTSALKNNLLKKIVFALLCISLPINLYIAIVLLPVLALIPFLAVFYPIILLYFFFYLLLIFHVQALFRIKQALTSGQGTPLAQAGFVSRVILLMLIIPLGTVSNAFLDKAVLHQAYYSMYNSDTIIRLDGGRLQSVLDEFSNRRRDSYLPFITPLRRALILENKNLDRKEAYKLYRFFLGYQNITYSPDEQVVWPRQVLIRDVREIGFSAHGSYMQSKVLIEIENPNQFTDEFYQVFEIPPDVFITDLSLWIGDSETKGLLARKEPALTVYTNIIRALRDPALLMYQNDGSCSLRVFPVEARQKRRAAITFCYRQPFVFTFDSKLIRIDHSLIEQPRFEGENKQPDIDPAVSNSMYRGRTEQVLHFIVDYSENADISIEQAADIIQDLLGENEWRGRVRFSLANYNWKTYDSLDHLIHAPSAHALAFRRQGAFVYSRVLTGLLREYDRTTQTPRFVIISNTNQLWLIHSSLLPYKLNYPALRQAYRLDSEGNLYKFSMYALRNEKQCDSLTDDDYATPVIMENRLTAQRDNLFPVISEYAQNSIAEIMRQNTHLDAWETNALLFALWSRGEILHDGDPARYEQLGRYAQKQDLLMPFLSYIVLENTDQENILKELDKNAAQATLLSDGKLKSVNMTEPPLFPFFIALIVILFVPIKKR